MSVSAGTRLGPYEILAAISAGGMGEVYKARDTRLDRAVAIKILPASLASDPEFRQRFDREASNPCNPCNPCNPWISHPCNRNYQCPSTFHHANPIVVQIRMFAIDTTNPTRHQSRNPT